MKYKNGTELTSAHSNMTAQNTGWLKKMDSLEQ